MSDLGPSSPVQGRDEYAHPVPHARGRVSGRGRCVRPPQEPSWPLRALLRERGHGFGIAHSARGPEGVLSDGGPMGGRAGRPGRNGSARGRAKLCSIRAPPSAVSGLARLLCSESPGFPRATRFWLDADSGRAGPGHGARVRRRMARRPLPRWLSGAVEGVPPLPSPWDGSKLSNRGHRPRGRRRRDPLSVPFLRHEHSSNLPSLGRCLKLFSVRVTVVVRRLQFSKKCFATTVVLSARVSGEKLWDA